MGVALNQAMKGNIKETIRIEEIGWEDGPIGA